MLKATLTALKGSIKKWERIVDGTGVDRGPHNCPLCDRFYWEDTVTRDECPCNARGLDCKCDGCAGTPYEEWSDHQTYKHYENKGPPEIFCPTCKRLAQVELDYLRGLLPGHDRGVSLRKE